MSSEESVSGMMSRWAVRGGLEEQGVLCLAGDDGQARVALVGGEAPVPPLVDADVLVY